MHAAPFPFPSAVIQARFSARRNSLPEPARIKHCWIVSQNRSAQDASQCRCADSVVTKKNPRSRQYPLTPSFDVLIEHDADICQDEPTDNEAKEFRCVSGAQLESDMDWRGMPQSWIFHLTDDLIYKGFVLVLDGKVGAFITHLGPVQHRTTSQAHPCSLGLAPHTGFG